MNVRASLIDGARALGLIALMFVGICLVHGVASVVANWVTEATK